MWSSKLCCTRSVLSFCSLARIPVFRSNRPFNILSSISSSEKAKKITQISLGFFSKSAIKLELKWPVRQCTIMHANDIYNKKRKLGFWLLGCSSVVYMALSLGGYTRLTESGLSMVTWRLAFENYPTSEEEWILEFEKYKQFPEFKQLKKDITLDEFKKIWKIEYFHRNIGRLLGIIFLLPAATFWAKGYFLPQMKKRIVVFGSLIGVQGLWGWYMVKSGLEDRFHTESDIPRVSHYRLAGHLALALTLYSGFFWTALELLIPPKTLELKHHAKTLRILTHCSKGIIFFTALSGAFVAGLDAGLIYNSFPKMGGNWIPDDILALKPIFKNITENPTTVQFIHRILGVTTFSLCIATWALSKRYPLSRTGKLAMNALAIAACYQAYLGYSTLINQVMLHQAIAHQSGSVLLLSSALLASQQLKAIKYLPK